MSQKEKIEGLIISAFDMDVKISVKIVAIILGKMAQEAESEIELSIANENISYTLTANYEEL